MTAPPSSGGAVAPEHLELVVHRVAAGDGAGHEAVTTRRCAPRTAAREVLGWPKRCKFAHALLWEILLLATSR
jgi:hypothetical protein